MTEAEHRRVIDELDAVIRDTRTLMERFEASGMDEDMAGDYAQLHDLYSRAVSDQKAHTLALLDAVFE
ncbi:hypothetical protein FIU88_00420 [Halomonas sp. THAF12]|uniref:hypothetical protein n=1 Tax=Halomonas sp. THAF12 TaxID=2587849 RepID=UPI001268569B|nr:hypothetical protein [Halomonas sp. THAF12]QFT83428.1 hypothetical protein FIU88_00420 [Halomonas sp. THAF12]